jgi:hypothetical protein
MLIPILQIRLSQFLGMEDEEIFRIVLLCGFGEVKGPSNHSLLVYNHNLVMGNGVLIIDEGGNPGIAQESEDLDKMRNE